MKKYVRPFIATLAIVLPISIVFALLGAQFDLPVVVIGLAIGCVAGMSFALVSKRERKLS